MLPASGNLNGLERVLIASLLLQISCKRAHELVFGSKCMWRVFSGLRERGPGNVVPKPHKFLRL